MGDEGGKVDEGGKKEEGGKVEEFKTPERYKDEKWASEIKDVDGLWNHLSGAQKLIGKKGTIIPEANAPDAEKRDFYTKQGCPENAEGYDFQNIEDLKDRERNTVVDNAIKVALHKRGVSKEDGEAIIKECEVAIYENAKPQLEKQAQVEQNFSDMMDKSFGDKRDETMEQFKGVMKESLDNPLLAAKMDELPNEALEVLLNYGKGIHDKYVGESKVKSGGPAGQNKGDLKTQYQNISQEKINLKLDSKVPQHIKDQKLAQLNKKMVELGSKANEKGLDLFS